MRRAVGGFALALTFLALIVLCVVIVAAPPDPVIRWLVGSALRSPAQWLNSSYEGGSLKVQMLGYPLPSARFKTAEAVIKNGIARSIFTGVWEIDLLNIQIQPTNPRWPSLRFASGRAVWRVRSNTLELRNWTSRSARLDADIHFDGSGRLMAADARGDADPLELAGSLSGWKILKADDGADRKTFHFMYTKGQLSILVDEKPFFKASWNGSVNF